MSRKTERLSQAVLNLSAEMRSLLEQVMECREMISEERFLRAGQIRAVEKGFAERWALAQIAWQAASPVSLEHARA